MIGSYISSNSLNRMPRPSAGSALSGFSGGLPLIAPSPPINAAVSPMAPLLLPTQKQVMTSPFGYPLTLYTLPNGHRIMVEQRPTDLVGIRTCVNTGSIVENAMVPSPLYRNIGLPPGIAHLDEHCHFVATEHFPLKNTVNRMLERYGIHHNATTNHEMIDHEITCNKEDWAAIAQLHTEMLMKPLYTADIQQEKHAVLNEKSYRERSPSMKLYSETFRLLFDRPVMQIVGSPQDIVSTLPEQIRQFYNLAYSPTNMLTVVSGNVDPNAVLNLMGPTFAANPSRNLSSIANQTLRVALRPNEVRTATVIDPQLTNSMVMMGFPAPPSSNYTERMAMEFLDELLCSDDLSVLPDQVMHREHSAISMGTEYIPFKQAGLWKVEMTMPPGQEQAALGSTLRTIGRFAQTPLTERDIAPIRERLIQKFLSKRNDVALATKLIGQEGVQNTLLYLQQYVQLANLLRPDEIQAVAQKYLNPNRYVAVVGKGQESAMGALPPSRPAGVRFGGQMQPGGLSSPFSSGVVPSARLINGAAGHFLQLPTQSRSLLTMALPLINIPPGTADVLRDLLTGGSDANKQLRHQLSNQGISFSHVATNGTLLLSLDGPAGQEPLLAQALLRLVAQPVLDPGLYRDIQSRAMAWQKNRLTNPDQTLITAYFQRIYGSTHPFAPSASEAIQNVAQANLADMALRWQQTLQAVGSAKVMMMSPLPVAAQQQIVNNAIAGSGWMRQPFSNSPVMVSPVPLPSAAGVRDRVLVPTTNTQRALVHTVWKAPDVRDPDYPAYVLLKSFLNGQDEGSLYKTLRQDHGLVYGANVVEGPQLAGGNCLICPIEVNANQVGPALNDIQQVTQAACQTTMDPVMLTQLKRTLVRESREARQTPEGIQKACYAPWLSFNGPLPAPNWLETAVANVTSADIQRVANRIFNAPNGLQLVGVTAPEAVLRQWFPGQPLTPPPR